MDLPFRLWYDVEGPHRFLAHVLLSQTHGRQAANTIKTEIVLRLTEILRQEKVSPLVRRRKTLPIRVSTRKMTEKREEGLPVTTGKKDDEEIDQEKHNQIKVSETENEPSSPDATSFGEGGLGLRRRGPRSSGG